MTRGSGFGIRSIAARARGGLEDVSLHPGGRSARVTRASGFGIRSDRARAAESWKDVSRHRGPEVRVTPIGIRSDRGESRGRTGRRLPPPISPNKRVAGVGIRSDRGESRGGLEDRSLRPTRRRSGWRRERDSNPRNRSRYSGFQDRRHKPLGHPSAAVSSMLARATIARRRDHLEPPMYGRSASGTTTRAVGLLVVLENRDQRAADGEARAVQRVRVLGLLRAVGAEADVGAARLEGLAVAAGRDLAIRRSGSAATPRCRRSSPTRSPCRRCTAASCDRAARAAAGCARRRRSAPRARRTTARAA